MQSRASAITSPRLRASENGLRDPIAKLTWRVPSDEGWRTTKPNTLFDRGVIERAPIAVKRPRLFNGYGYCPATIKDTAPSDRYPMEHPVTDEVVSALGKLWHAGSGPSHTVLTSCFLRAGYGRDDPYDPTTQTPNKERRVQVVSRAAMRRPVGARKLIDSLLVELRVHGDVADADGRLHPPMLALQAALRRAGWTLSDDGVLSPGGQINLATGGRDALDEQITRLRRSTDDPGALLGSAKDLLESTAKFVLEELVDDGIPKNDDFAHLWHLARDRLGILPEQVNVSSPGGASIRKILQSAWTIALEVNTLRGLQGAGHGRTLPTGVSPDVALLVVREACSVAELTLSTLDRQRGRAD